MKATVIDDYLDSDWVHCDYRESSTCGLLFDAGRTLAEAGKEAQDYSVL
jgi:hypothetical protein